MGDAGPPTPPPGLVQDGTGRDTLETTDAPALREVRVLVTGFGPFKSFLINPSWLIASALPEDLFPVSGSKYKIKLIVHPSAIRVSYSTVSETVPELIRLHNPDLILHIGMAGGRDCYSLETRGHRDGYRIKDVDNLDGYLCGECKWKRDGVPPLLYCMWDEDDVLSRWEAGVQRELVARGFLGPVDDEKKTENTTHRESEVGTNGDNDATSTAATTSATDPSTTFAKGNNAAHDQPRIQTQNVASANDTVTERRAAENRKRSVVKLSRDAGRFLCEFALFSSLSYRWLEARKEEQEEKNAQNEDKVQGQERLGKVAFLHVPGWTGVEDVNRGVMVAEEAIKALVGSWEDGLRRKEEGEGEGGFTTQNSELR
ncbi:hypothetical protein PV08_05548 [Exophiala spinifera]|uniref:Pyroglutamyl-peptidase I n=1 Tax=Exophiala spinifera TaxID=91928 RepID=A0A0D1ZRX5_9EURO|nr:uncharacterized protein PV08_05548 [Exophiala spinifera]KIW15502.1 hypothetical protein PV08_05548 [Exophiala spinifera]